MTVQLTPSDFLDTIEALTKLENAINSGGSALTLTDGSTTVDDVSRITISGGTVGGSSPDATLTISGGGGGNTITLTADTDIAAGTAVAINSSGHAVQTWGPAPNIADLTTLFSGVGAGSNSKVSTLLLDATHFAAFDTSDQIGAVACSIAGEVISCGAADTSAQSLNAPSWGPNNAFIIGAGLDGSTYVVAYNDPTSGNATVAASSISSNIISPGTPVQITTQGFNNQIQNSVIRLNATTFVLTYGLADQSQWAVAGTVAGNTITLGTPVQLSVGSGSVSFVPSAVLSSSSFLTVYIDNGNSQAVTAVIGTVSGTTITLGTPSVLTGVANAGYLYLSILTLTSFVLLVGLNAGAPSLYAGDISGGAVTFGSALAVPNSTYNSTYIQAFNATQLIAYGTLPVVVSVSGLSLAVTTVFQLPPGDTGNFPSTLGSIAVLTDSLFILTDTDVKIYEATASLLSDPIHHQFLTGYWLYPLSTTAALAVLTDTAGLAHARVINAQPINNGPVAFASSAVTSGNPGTFTTSGVATGFSGLTPGASYYVNGDGTLTTGNTGHPAGVALSATELLIQ